MAAPAEERMRFAAMLACLLSISGCAHLRVPAIDPTGTRIFLPSPASTTLQTPCQGLRGPSCLPRPAFTEPPAVPDCPTRLQTVTPQPRPIRQVASANIPDRLVLTPSKLVAPVGTEVVLLAGLSGADGQYLTKQPIEWLLSQESVGNFVSVGEDNHPRLTHLLHKPPKKMSSNFAIAQSSAESKLITRGTASQADDIWLQKGQSWVTLSSASEGTTHVTAIASKSDNWEQRRQTATIQWIDAQWQLPAPAAIRAGQVHPLSTTITRSSTGGPIRGWLVRYTVVSGPPVQFGINGSQSIEVASDANGRAAVNVQPSASAEPGVTQIKIEILSPSLTGLTGDPVVIGQGMTTISWSAPGLRLRVLGPATAAVGSTVTYQIEVSNPGDLPADAVTVNAELPLGRLKFVSGEGQQFGSRRTWQIDRLEPGRPQTLTLRAQVIAPGAVSLFVTATGNNGVSAPEARADTELLESAFKLSVELVNRDPERINVGDKITYNIAVANTSNAPLTNVFIRDTFEPGLAHADGSRSPITQQLGNLAPGAVREFGLSFVAQQAGKLCHHINVGSSEGHTAESGPNCVQVAQPAGELSVDVLGPAEITDRQKATYEIVVRNPSQAELTGVVIEVSIDDSLNPTDASHGYQVLDTNVLAWRIVSIGPGNSEQRVVVCEPAALDESSVISVRVASDQGVTTSKSISTQVRRAEGPAPVAPRARQPDPANLQPPANGELRLELDDATAGVAVNDRIFYVLRVTNDRQGFADDIRINLRFSESLTFADVTREGQAVRNVSVQPDRLGASVFFNQMRPGEAITLRVQAQATRAGQGRLEVDVTSQQAAEAVKAIETTPIRPN